MRMFTDDKYQKLYIDWERYAKDLVGRFRLICGQYIEDSWLIQFVDDLKTQSAEFNSWWSLHEIQSNAEIYKRLNHPVAGIMDFEISNFDLSNGTGFKLVVHVPSPETDTVEKMKSLLYNKPGI